MVVSLPERVRLLANVPAFMRIPPEALNHLAETMQEGHYPAGSVIVSEGETGDRLYVISQGRAQAITDSPSGPIILASLEEGEIFGEIASLSPSRKREATIVSVSPLLTLSINANAFEHILNTYPHARKILDEIIETVLIYKFLKKASPFSHLSHGSLKRLSGRLGLKTVPAGSIIIKQGETGDSCYLLRSGSVEIIMEQEGIPERRIATLHAGALIGEASLLTDLPRNATVKSIKQCELLVLTRDDLIRTMTESHTVRLQIMDLVRLREKPLRKPEVIVYQQATHEGGKIITLKDPERGAYYRLSKEGLFIWERMDGRHTLRDIALDYLSEFNLFAPQAIAGIIAGLSTAGFLVAHHLSPDITNLHSAAWVKRLFSHVRQSLEWRLYFTDVDKPVDLLYEKGVKFIYTYPAQFIIFLLSFSGLSAFLFSFGSSAASFQRLDSAIYFIFFVPAYLLSIILHEAGHAFTTKGFGREVRGIGIGWHWGVPIAFVDTSDMWLSGRLQRLAVSLAGPYANMLIAGIASIFVLLVQDQTMGALLWQFALISYLTVLVNLNPLLEFDGYYMLADILKQPNLRKRTIEWASRGFSGSLKENKPELAYIIISLLYIVIIIAVIAVLYRLFLIS